MSLLLKEISEFINYDPESGKFTWKISNRHYCKAGDKAGYIDANGYQVIKAKGYRCLGHRLAWYITYGSEPKSYIDHINGNPSDNRLDNLRVCSQQQNMFNRKRRSDNTSGHTGVCKHRDKWRSYMKVNGKTETLGYFNNKEDAINCYKKAASEYQGEFYREQ